MRSYQRRTSVFIGCLFLSSFQSTFAATPAGTPSATGTTAVAAHATVNLDLSSTKTNLSGGHLLGSNPVNIQVGQSTLAVTKSTLLTPAERMAVYQVVSTGSQSIVLSAQGSASGGSFTIGPKFSQFVSSLTIPQGVTALKNFGTSSTLNLLGNLTNSGTFYAFSSNPAITNAVINAANITNNQGGLLTTIAPSGFAYPGMVPNLNLTINAVNNLINAGTIRSAGNFTATAGGSIVNALPTGAIGAAPLMQALNNVNLQSSNLINSGLITSQTANINIATLASSNLLVQNVGGRLYAPLGDINVRDANFAGKVTSDILGGVLDSKQVNIYAAEGSADVAVDALSGILNMSAFESHSSVQSGNLNLGNLTFTGDPDFYNANGDVVLGGTILLGTPGTSLAVVASGNILSNPAAPFPGPVSIFTYGGTLSLVAGAKVSCVGGPCGASPGSHTLLITGFNPTGDINLSNLTKLNTTLANGNGGNIMLAAPGKVVLGGGIIDTGGDGIGHSSGDFTVIAGATGFGTAVQIASGVTTAGYNNATSGNISIYNRAPGIKLGPTGNPCVFFFDGVLGTAAPTLSGTIVPKSAAFISGDVTVSGALFAGNLVGQNAGTVLIDAPGSVVSVASIDTTSLTGNGGAVTINAGNALYASGSIQSFSNPGAGKLGGAVTLNSSGVMNVAGISASGDTGSAIKLNAAADLIAGNLNTSGAQLNAGDITIGSGGSVTVGNVASTSTNGRGGTVKINAANKITGTWIAAASNTSGGVISLSAKDVLFSSQVGNLSLTSSGNVSGGSIIIQATDTASNLVVGVDSAISGNGTAFDIGADGPGGLVHVSNCSSLIVELPRYITAIGGQVIVDHACCGSAASNLPTVSGVQALSGVQVYVVNGNLSLAPPQDTALATDTAYGGNLALVASPPGNLTSLIPPTTGSSFQGAWSPTNSDGTINSVFTPMAALKSDGFSDSEINTIMSLVSDFNGDTIARIIAQGGGNIIVKLLTQDGAGLLTQDSAGLLTQDGAGFTTDSLAKIIAQGGGNAIAKIIAQGGGNIIAQGGGNIIAQGGGNIIAQGGGNVVNAIAQIIAQGGGNAISPKLLTSDGASLVVHMNGVVAQGGGNLIGQDGAGVIAQGGGNLAASLTNGSSLVSPNGGNLTSSLANAGSLVSTNGGNGIASGSFGALANPLAGSGAFSGRSYVSNASSKQLVLTKGALLVNPGERTSVLTEQGIVHMASGVIALLLEVENNSLAVYNLHDDHKDQMFIETGGTIVPLAPGKMVTLSSRKGSFDTICPGHGLTYRNPMPIKTARGMTGYMSDFSIASALANVPPLLEMAKSSNPVHKKAFDKMIKDAAIVMQLQSKNGPYQALQAQKSRTGL